jgi:H+/Cl- antiporter ClcA
VDQTWKHELIGSAAFLASSMKMPLTAIVLIFEFTRVGHDFLIPISLAVTGSISAFHLCVERETQPTWRAHHEDILIGPGDPVLNRVRAATQFFSA